jgi:hypothetical protein
VDYGFTDILTLPGALGLFLYGMKVMSDALLDLAGDRMRKILATTTTNRSHWCDHGRQYRHHGDSVANFPVWIQGQYQRHGPAGCKLERQRPFQGLYQIAEVTARSCRLLGSGATMPSFRASNVVQRGVGISMTRA